jgi:hypothetical protein
MEIKVFKEISRRYEHEEGCKQAYRKSFFSLTSFTCSTVGAKGHCCTWSHKMRNTRTHTHTHSGGLPWTTDRPVATTSNYTAHNKDNKQTPMTPAGFSLSFCPFYPLCTFISFVLMSLIPLQYTTQTSMPPAGFEPKIPVGDRPQTLALHCSATVSAGFEPAISTIDRSQTYALDGANIGTCRLQHFWNLENS